MGAPALPLPPNPSKPVWVSHRAASRMVLLLLGYLAFISLGLPDTVIGVAWPSVRDAYGLSQAGLGAFLVATGAGYFLSGLFAGRILGALGLANVLVLSTALVTMGLSAFALALPWPLPLVVAFAIGLGSGAIDAGINTFAAAQFSARQVNWLHACYSLGATIGPVLMTAVLAAGPGGWRLGYAGLAAMLAGMTAVFAATRAQWKAPLRSDGGTREVAGGALAALRHPLVPIQTVLFFCYTGIEAGLGQWAFTVNMESRAVSVETAGLWTSTYWGCLFLGRVLIGAAVDRIGADRLVRLCTLGILAGAVLFALGPPLVGLVGLIVAAFALAPVYPTLISRTSTRLPPEVAIHAVGFKVSAAMAGASTLPFLAGILAERSGLWVIGWVMAAAAVALLALHEALLRFSRANATAAPGGKEGSVE
jgi:fucose permease